MQSLPHGAFRGVLAWDKEATYRSNKAAPAFHYRDLLTRGLHGHPSQEVIKAAIA